MIRVAIVGARGRMGEQLIRAVAAREGAELGAAVERAGHPDLGLELAPGAVLGSDLSAALEACDVAIDFSGAEGTEALLEATERDPHPLVIGTTGLPEAVDARLRRAAQLQPIVFAPNFSIGVAVLSELVALAAQRLPEYDLEILELHHSAKVDAPSGTALRLAELAARARGVSLEDVARYARHGHTGPRPAGQIGLQTLRGGTSAGEHTVFLAGPGERIEISHRALSREGFASGAVRAACWAVGQPPGLYGIADVS